MTGRERVRTAMSRRLPDRVPRSANFTPALMDRFRQETGASDPAEYWQFDVGWVGFRGPEKLPDFLPYHPEGIPEGSGQDEYGVVMRPGSFFHFQRYQYPLDHDLTLADLEAFPWPDFTPAFRHEHLEADVARLHEQGLYVAASCGHIWEQAWQMLSMPKLMLAFLEEADLAEFVVQRIAQNADFMARRYTEAGVDMLRCGDDVAMQDRLMMSPATWRRWLRPTWEGIWKRAKQINPQVQLWYHSDGNIAPLIPDLIEMGLEILNPVQPECVDPVAIKREYGDRLAFWGCVGTQTTFPFGTPEQMRAEVKHLVETVGAGGGLYLEPTHVLEPDVPWENVVAFFEACDEFGRYD